jgi:hypothetical protein
VVLVPDAFVAGQAAVALIFAPGADLLPDSYIPLMQEISGVHGLAMC